MPNPTKLIFVPPSGGTVDWSQYFINISPIQRRIESDKPGEAGVMMFDTVTIEMPLSKTGSYFSEELLFGGSTKPKYHVQIKKHISGTDYQLFEGLIDVDSLKFTRHGTVQFDCYDKLSALKFYPTLPAREKLSLVSSRCPSNTDHIYIGVVVTNQPYMAIKCKDDENNTIQFTTTPIKRGDVIIDPKYYDETGLEKLFLAFGSHNRDWAGYWNDIYAQPKPTQGYYGNYNDMQVYDYKFYNYNIGYGSGDMEAFDAIKMLKAIIWSAYPSITIVNKISYLDVQLISLGFFEQTVNMPFDRPILEAIKYLAASMRVYVYIDRSGQFIIDKWPGFGSEPSSKQDLSGFQTEDDYRFTWDKLVDKVTIETVAADGSKTEAVAGTEYKNPVNTLERTVFASDDSAQDIADDYFEFYGKRHRARSITRKLDATVAQLDLTSWVDLGDIDFRDDSDLYYFIEKMALDVMNDTVDLDLVSVKTFDL